MRITSRTLLLPLAALALVAACDDPTEVGEHMDIEGVALEVAGTEIYRYTLDDGLPSALALDIGAYEAAIVFLDHDGDPITHAHEEGEEGEQLDVTISDPAVLTWTPETEAGHEHEALEFHGELNALQAGETSMSICILHGEHCDFEVDIPVTVGQ
ncbi:MAG TPA: hypothetical protein VK966_04620 [Longimicrobiales bacterium]|nr:hypothetical protein [Longimicrobiales bacterium]